MSNTTETCLALAGSLSLTVEMHYKSGRDVDSAIGHCKHQNLYINAAPTNRWTQWLRRPNQRAMNAEKKQLTKDRRKVARLPTPPSFLSAPTTPTQGTNRYE